MKGKGKTAGKGRAGARAPLALAAAALAVTLVFTGSYAYAKYATEYGGVTAPVALFDVTSYITYEDAWGTAQAFDGYLGTMKPDESEMMIYFTLTVENNGDVPVCFAVTLFENYGYGFSFNDWALYDGTEVNGEAQVSGSDLFSLSNDDKTLSVEYPVASGGAVTILLYVNIGSYEDETSKVGVDVHSTLLDIEITYTQAG